MPALQFDKNGPESVVAQTFFYLLDVGTSNALVLYNELVKTSLQPPAQHTPMNIVQFKMKLVEDLVGRSIPVHIEGGVRLQCAYCALMSRTRRSRYQCAGWQQQG
jgi:hypothetical protein